MMEVMWPGNPRWHEFTERLDGPEGCDFREQEPGNVMSITCECNGTKGHAVAILEKMGGVNIDKSLAFFEEHGGFCDCEILYNVEDSYIRELDERLKRTEGMVRKGDDERCIKLVEYGGQVGLRTVNGTNNL